MVEIFNIFKDRPVFEGMESCTPVINIDISDTASYEYQKEYIVLSILAEIIQQHWREITQVLLQEKKDEYKIDVQSILERGILYPRLVITTIKESGLKCSHQKDNIPVLIFQLPPALSFAYDFKKYYKQLHCFAYPHHRQRIKDDSCRTSRIYNSGRGLIWKIVKTLNIALYGASFNFQIKRMNDRGDHNGEYYYVFAAEEINNCRAKSREKRKQNTQKKRRAIRRQLRYDYLR